jgi:hypothetical protein
MPGYLHRFKSAAAAAAATCVNVDRALTAAGWMSQHVTHVTT